AANALAVLLGQRPGVLEDRLGDASVIPVHASRIAVGLPAELLRRRPDLRQLEREIAAQTALIGAAEAQHYPRVELLGSIGRQSAGAGELFDHGSEVYAFGPRVSWPIFAGGAIEARVEAEEARLEQLRYRYEAAALEAWREASDALDAYLREHDRRDALATAVEHARVAVAKSEALYEAGLVDFQSVIDDQRTQFEVEDDLAVSEARIAASVVALYRALGGGFDAPDGG
ncbi:MAG: TolC family protein, partial [Planctomycetota bacterium JB042]